MGAVNQVVDLSVEGGVAVVSINSPPVNTLSVGVRDGLAAAFQRVLGNAAIQAIVLICEGRTFIAGADIAGFGKPPQGASLLEVLKGIEGASQHVVAAIHGTALGGGFEVALACHYRVAVPSAKCGLPEVKLGLLPGAGGTQRLPRIVGVARALEMLTSGEHVGAKACFEMGLVDALVEEGKLREGAIAFARALIADKRPLKKVRDLDEKLVAARSNPQVFADFRKANARKFRGFDAPNFASYCHILSSTVGNPTVSP